MEYKKSIYYTVIKLVIANNTIQLQLGGIP